MTSYHKHIQGIFLVNLYGGGKKKKKSQNFPKLVTDYFLTIAVLYGCTEFVPWPGAKSKRHWSLCEIR